MVKIMEATTEDTRRKFFPDEVFFQVQAFHNSGIGIGDLAETYMPLGRELAFCRVVDYYLFYIAELLALIFRTKPEALKSNEHVTVESVLQHSTLEELIESISERKVLDLSFKGVFALADYLKRRLSLELFDSDADMERVVRIVEYRNLFVHNRGVVNRLYLSRVPTATEKIGEKIQLNGEQVTEDVVYLMGNAKAVDAKAVAKFGIPAAMYQLSHSKLDISLRELADVLKRHG
jgi:hypothetical protein